MVDIYDKHQNFKRLATNRTNSILKRLKILSNCANRSSYDYSEDDVEKIFFVIDQAVKEARAKFYFPGDKNFKL